MKYLISDYTPAPSPFLGPYGWTVSLHVILSVTHARDRLLKTVPALKELNIFIMAVDPCHTYSNGSERTNQDINGDFKLKKNDLHVLYKNNSAL